MTEIQDTLFGSSSLLNEMVLQCLEPTLEQAGISMSAFDLLSATRMCGLGASQAEVARTLGITAPSLSEAVKNAVRLGILDQVPSQLDARAKILRITPKGAQKLEKIEQSLNQIETKMVQGLTASDIRVALRVLHFASKNLAKALTS